MTEHDRTRLGPYVLGGLDPAEHREVAEHLAGCADCRAEVAEFEEMKEYLGEVPPEAFLDGPPEGGDLMLQRTLQAVRTEAESFAASDRHPGAPTASDAGPDAPAAHHPSGGPGLPPRPSEPARASSGGRRVWLLAAAAVVLIAGVLAGGIAIGRQTVDPVVATQQPTLAPGSREVTTTDPVSRVTMATTVEPRQDWSYVHVKLTGVPAGSECELIVTDKAGKGWIAGSWIIGEKGAREGARFGGGVVVPADQVTSVQLKTLEGKVLASTRF